MGRKPIPLTEEHLRQAEDLARLAIPEHQIATILGISPRTLANRKASGDEDGIVAALEKGKAESRRSLTRVLWDIAHNPSATNKDRAICSMYLLKVLHQLYDTRPKEQKADEANEALERFKAIVSTLEERARGDLEIDQHSSVPSGSVDQPGEDGPQKTLPPGQDIQK